MGHKRPLRKPRRPGLADSQRRLHGLVIAALLAACALLLAACGGGQQATASSIATQPAAAVPVSNSGQRPPSRAQALAFAHAVNLTAADIPEASVAHGEDSTDSARERREFQACDGSIEHAHALVEVMSPKLKRGRELEIEQIRSSVAVVRDARAIPAEAAELARPSLLECAAHVLTRNYSDKAIREARWGRFTVSKLPVHVPGRTVTIGIRIVATLNLAFSEVSVPIYVDVLGFESGPAEITLTATSVTQPMPAGTEQELLALLSTRAQAHAL